MKEIIEKLLQEKGIDQDIKDLMLKENKSMMSRDRCAYNYELVNDPVAFIISWQALRHSYEDRQNKDSSLETRIFNASTKFSEWTTELHNRLVPCLPEGVWNSAVSPVLREMRDLIRKSND